MSIENRLIRPRDVLIEKVAGKLAAEWFEAAKNTPQIDTLRKKYRNDPRRFARINLEKFIPTAVQILIGMLGPNSTTPLEAKEEIYNALISRNNDPVNMISDDIINNNGVIPNIDVNKIIDATRKPVDRIAQLMDREVHKHLPTILELNPGQAQRH